MVKKWSSLPASRGQALVELLVAIGLTAIILPALLTGMIAAREGRAQEAQRLVATTALVELEAAVRSVREKGWAQFAVNGTFHPTISGSSWSLTAGTQTQAGFTRQVVISDVQRDAAGAIVASGGTVDPATKRVDVTVSWSQPISSSVESTFYLSRWVANTAWSQTTQANFAGGTLSNTVVTNTSGGEVQLAPGAGGNWGSVSLVGQFNTSPTSDALDVFVSGNYAYLVAGSVLTIVDVTTPASPTQVGSVTLAGTLNAIFVSGNYAYIASSDNSKELIVVNVTNKAAPAEVGSLNASGNQDALAVYVDGSFAYLGRTANPTSQELHIVNVATPTAPTNTGVFEVGFDVNSVWVFGNQTYLATDDNNRELIILNSTTKSAPALVGSYNANSNSDAEDIWVVGSTAYLVTLNNSTGPEFYILNVATPTSISLTGSYNVAANTMGVAVSGTYALLATELANKQFLVLSISNPGAPSEAASLNLAANSNEVRIGGDYAYVASDNNSRELAIIGSGAGASFQTSGTFESSTFDAGQLVAFNYLTFTITEPANTNVVFQVAINTDNSTWNYTGAYESPGEIPLANTVGRYLRYRATLTGPGTVTPVFSDVAVNYSP